MASARTLARKKCRQKAKANTALRARASTTLSNGQVVENKPKAFLDLPYDVRYMIYKLCFIRPVGIVPKDSFYRCNLPRNDKHQVGDGLVTRKYSLYQYQWESNIQQIPQMSVDGLPTRDGTLNDVTTFRISSATPEQLKLIADNTVLLNTGTSTDEHSDIHNFVIASAGDLVEVVSEQSFYISGFTGVRFLAICKQVRDEGAEILYGSNEFIFETNNTGPLEKFQDNPDQVPGARLSDDTLPSQEQIDAALEKLFDRKVRHPKCVWYDGLLRFLGMIGRHNAGRLKSGLFSNMSFGEILSVYTVAMSNVCTNLTRMTLHKQRGSCRWEIEQPEDEGNTDGERVSEVMEKLVNGLPQLKELHLGCLNVSRVHRDGTGLPHDAFGLSRDQRWGTSMKWIDFVKERARSSLEEISNEDATETETNEAVETNEDVDQLADQLASTI
ncbi:hypothetical protein IFR05_012758 [Cadophora sp. M221]|nr:hypothetical protein IFR05_012758 [Cadophora sp. M221]